MIFFNGFVGYFKKVAANEHLRQAECQFERLRPKLTVPVRLVRCGTEAKRRHVTEPKPRELQSLVVPRGVKRAGD